MFLVQMRSEWLLSCVLRHDLTLLCSLLTNDRFLWVFRNSKKKKYDCLDVLEDSGNRLLNQRRAP